MLCPRQADRSRCRTATATALTRPIASGKTGKMQVGSLASSLLGYFSELHFCFHNRHVICHVSPSWRRSKSVLIFVDLRLAFQVPAPPLHEYTSLKRVTNTMPQGSLCICASVMFLCFELLILGRPLHHSSPGALPTASHAYGPTVHLCIDSRLDMIICPKTLTIILSFVCVQTHV